MCGIIAVIGKQKPELVAELSELMSHRGPDQRDMHVEANGNVLSHERLSIIDLKTGKQPIQGTTTAYLVHNGEIYNHQSLRDNELSDHTFRTTSDSEVIVHLYEKHGYDFCNKLDGVFAFVVVDGDKTMAARDPIGVKPMYYGTDEEGNMYFSSEMKALSPVCTEFKAFPPGYYYTKETGFVKYYQPQWAHEKVVLHKTELPVIREKLTQAVEKRLMSDVPLGVLLSGGLDSSLISAIAKRKLAEQGDQVLHSFSIGLNADAPDLVAAREVAEFIGTTHHEVHFSVEQGIEALKKIVWHLETYDVTTIRAATPMYFLSEAITKMGVKVVLSGEGADEIFGGYLYFHNAPNASELRKETVSRVQRLSTADCLRADKSTMAHGLEARVPFLDKDFLDYTMALSGEDKRPDRSIGKSEKHILRAAFDDKDQPYIPDSVLWRQKEQFGDGVGYSWIDGLVAHANDQITETELQEAKLQFTHNTPETKEALLYRRIYNELFPGAEAAKTVLKWIPKWQNSTDPSGRVCDSHEEHVEELKHDVKSSVGLSQKKKSVIS